MPHVMTNRGVILDLEQAFQALMDYHVIFFGESHDSRIAHEAELSLLGGLLERDASLALALEMFERDVQDALNAYLEGTIPEDRFLELSRPWHNYHEDYRPLVEMARARKIPVIGANVPRRTATLVAAADAISSDIVGDDSIFLPSSLHLDSEEYHDRFIALVAQMPPLVAMKGMNVEGLYKAQVLKDAVMADSLEPFLDRRILFCCGHFHCDYHLGIPYQLQRNHPEIGIAVVVHAESVVDLPMKDRSQVADFIWIDE